MWSQGNRRTQAQRYAVRAQSWRYPARRSAALAAQQPCRWRRSTGALAKGDKPGVGNVSASTFELEVPSTELRFNRRMAADEPELDRSSSNDYAGRTVLIAGRQISSSSSSIMFGVSNA